MIFGKSKEEQLIQAIRDKDTVKINQLIQRGVNLDYRDHSGGSQASPLDYAVAIGDVDLVHLLLGNEANANSKSRNGYTALHVASISLSSKPEIVDSLIWSGGDVNAKSFIEQWTPLALASKKVPSDEALVRQLVEAGAHVNDPNSFGETPLMYAAAFADEALVEYLLRHGADPRLVNNDGESALHFAAKSTAEQYMSAMESSIQQSMHMIGAGATFHDEGRNALAKDYADRNNSIRPKVIGLLLEYAANIDAPTALGLTPLQYAIFAQGFEIANSIIRHGAQLDVGDETPLMTAAWCNRLDTVELLIEKGADVNRTKATGENALEWALFKGYDDIAKLLVRAGAKRQFSAQFLEFAAANKNIAAALERLDLAL